MIQRQQFGQPFQRIYRLRRLAKMVEQQVRVIDPEDGIRQP